MMHRAEILGSRYDQPEQFKEYVQKVHEQIAAGVPLKAAAGLPEEMLEHIYTVAYDLFSAGDYEAASGYFDALNTFDPQNASYLIGWGACQHHKGAYSQAATAYLTALELDDENPLPLYYVADCFLKLGEHDAAREAWQEFIKSTAKQPQFASQRKLADMMLAMHANNSNI